MSPQRDSAEIHVVRLQILLRKMRKRLGDAVQRRGDVTRAFLCAAAILLLCGCQTGASPSSNTPCVLPAVVTAALVAPAPGSTNNDTNPSQITFATSSSIPTSWAGVLYFPGSMGSGIARFLTTIQVTTAPNSTPPAFVLPSFANPVYYATFFQGNPLPSGATITVAIYDTSSNCSPGITIGTFTTSP